MFPSEDVAKYNKHLQGITRDLGENMNPVLRKQQIELPIVKSKPVRYSFAPWLQSLFEEKNCLRIIKEGTNQKKHSLMSKEHLRTGAIVNAPT